MNRSTEFVIAVCLLAVSLSAAEKRNRARYEKPYRDPVLKALGEERQKQDQQLTRQGEEIRKRQAEERAATPRLELQSDLAGVLPPLSPAACRPVFHFPPQAQYATNICWSFATTSFYESEIHRLTNRRIKLSEVWTVYWEYVEKVRRWVRERGQSLVAEGGESNALPRLWRTYGVVPEEVYPGRRVGDGQLDHVRLIAEVQAFLEHVRRNELWDENDVLSHLAVILNKHLGMPPQSFAWQGRTLTPQQFLAQETGLKMDDYVEVMSTLQAPFYSRGEFLVPDNWWHSRDYVNLPLDVWYALILQAIRNGYSVVIGGDVSEPGKLGFQDVCFVPTFDIPAAFIDQDAREFRISNRTTEDDHSIHLVGTSRVQGHDWFLIKDSGRSARWGKFPGYFFFRGDYVKLKVLTYTVHKDALRDVLPRVSNSR